MGDSNAIGHPLSPVGSLRAVAPPLNAQALRYIPAIVQGLSKLCSPEECHPRNVTSAGLSARIN